MVIPLFFVTYLQLKNIVLIIEVFTYNSSLQFTVLMIENILEICFFFKENLNRFKHKD